MTTILSVRRNGKLAMAGDGQVTLGNQVMKGTAKKVRSTYNGQVVAGFAGSTADAFTLFEKFDSKLEEFNGNLLRAAVELAKDWRTSKVLRNLEALLAVGNAEASLIISGNGDVIETDDGIIGIGSGGPYALSAARALMRNSELSAKEIVTEAMKIAAEICIYSNDQFQILEIEAQ